MIWPKVFLLGCWLHNRKSPSEQIDQLLNQDPAESQWRIKKEEDLDSFLTLTLNIFVGSNCKLPKDRDGNSRKIRPKTSFLTWVDGVGLGIDTLNFSFLQFGFDQFGLVQDSSSSRCWAGLILMNFDVWDCCCWDTVSPCQSGWGRSWGVVWRVGGHGGG